MWKDSNRNIVVIFQTNILRILGFYVRHSAQVLGFQGQYRAAINGSLCFQIIYSFFFYCDEMERSVQNSLCVVKRVMESKNVVVGGGAVEAALSISLENFANTHYLQGKYFLAIWLFF